MVLDFRNSRRIEARKMRQKMNSRSLPSHGLVSHTHQLSNVDVDAESGYRLLVFVLILGLGVVARSYVDGPTIPDATRTTNASHGLGVSPTVVGTSKGGSQTFKRRGHMQLR